MTSGLVITRNRGNTVFLKNTEMLKWDTVLVGVTISRENKL